MSAFWDITGPASRGLLDLFLGRMRRHKARKQMMEFVSVDNHSITDITSALKLLREYELTPVSSFGDHPRWKAAILTLPPSGALSAQT